MCFDLVTNTASLSKVVKKMKCKIVYLILCVCVLFVYFFKQQDVCCFVVIDYVTPVLFCFNSVVPLQNSN